LIPTATAPRLAVGLLALALPVLAAGCGSGGEKPAGAATLSFKLTDAGCKPHDATVNTGDVFFEVENAGTTKVSEFEVLDGDSVLGEKEDLTEGLDGSFSLDLEPGSYTLYCPGGDQERGKLTVTGS
jgi:iron uptake system component EfeO